MPSAHRVFATGGVALIGASVIAATPMPAPPSGVDVSAIQLSAGETDVTIDIVKHGATTPPPPDWTSETPGAPLCTVAPCGGGSPPDQTGIEQADATAQFLHEQLGSNVSGIFSGTSTRALETAAPFAAYYPDTEVQQLVGLNEVLSSLYLPQAPTNNPGVILLETTVLLWAMGLLLVPMPGGVPINGAQLDQYFTGAIDTMYDNGMANPVVSDNGQITEVGFNSELSLFTWTMLNVKNPDLLYFIPALIHNAADSQNQLLDFGGIVQFNGNPTDGWTLDSWNGTAIPTFNDPLTELFVLTRDLIVPPQLAAWAVFDSLFSGDPTTILTAIRTGTSQLISAWAQWPSELIDYITGILHGDLAGSLAGVAAEPVAAEAGVAPLLGGFNPGDLAAGLANLLPTTELAELLPGELGSTVIDLLASL